MSTVLITGTTGFLGSNITRSLVEKGYKVYATHRNHSSFKRCKDFYDSITWINTEKVNWKELYSEIKIDIFIHTAWQGVSANERDNWEIQLSNFKFSTEVYELAKRSGTKKIITLGSQAEYGIYKEKVNENDTPIPINAYGSVKLLTLYFLRNFATDNEIDWYWIRVFSVFGTNEDENWLIPTAINNLLQGRQIALTDGLQKYDYLHSDEFVNNLFKVIECDSNHSGIYNLCSGVGIEIRSLLNKLSQFIPGSEQLLNFGTIPYRKNQNMFMVGDNTKFVSKFGNIYRTDLETNLRKTINRY
ncbi:MAG: NAD(P)-dependent oxidoreductase [bacterium]